MCCTWLDGNTGITGCKNDAKNRHLRTITIKSCINNRKNNLLNSNTSSTCPHNMVNFGPLTAEISSLLWGTPANFNRFRVLEVLLHGTLVVGISQTAVLNRGHHLYLAGRPSRWTLAHILVLYFIGNSDTYSS